MSSFSEAYKVPSLKKKLWFTFLIVSACVVLSLVPVPFLSHSGAASEVIKWGDTGVLMNVLSFGALGNGAVISLGIYPFLIASIAMQIITIAVPKLRNLAMEGDAGAKKIGNLTVVIDNNGLQIDGKIDDVCSPYPIDKKLEAFNFNTICIDGHDFDQIRDAFAKAKECKGMPTAIIMKTTKGKGVSYMENQAGWHGKAPNDEEYEQAMKELDEQLAKYEAEV